jgi:hypothetical protein
MWVEVGLGMFIICSPRLVFFWVESYGLVFVFLGLVHKPSFLSVRRNTMLFTFLQKSLPFASDIGISPLNVLNSTRFAYQDSSAAPEETY